ncbi:MAG TPA: SusC/RagA family TonB-linked outer membrane protein [Lunatimonas sp.]|nr:SusC/RagA family TonB-linked outer membrane protein [Lunatimonas sp.]
MKRTLLYYWKMNGMAMSMAILFCLSLVPHVARSNSSTGNFQPNWPPTNLGNASEDILNVPFEVTVTGTVTDQNGEPIPGATVSVPGTSIGTATDMNGKYSITVPENSSLVFSFIGFENQTIEVNNQSTIDVTLVESAQALDEVIVIGYGTQKKKDMTGAIVNVKAEEVMKYKPTSVSEILRTTVPGLSVGYATNARNVPEFDVRGDASMKADLNNDGNREEERAANRPLIVLDGVIFRGDLAEINPNSIESVDVLKDASAAAVYGSQATNGVVIFTTKKGSFGKPQITFSNRTGLITGARRQETYKGGEEVLNWLTDMNESITNTITEPWTRFRDYNSIDPQYQSAWLAANGIPGETNPDVINLARVNNFNFWDNELENYRNGITHDWQDFLFHTGVRQDYDVSISGRTERVSYYYALGYSDRESVVRDDKFKTITSRLNLDVNLAEFFSIGANAQFTYQDEGPMSIPNGGYRSFSPYDQPWRNNMPRTRENLSDQPAGSNLTNPYLAPSWNTRSHTRFMINPTLYAMVTLPLGISLRTDYTPRFDVRKRFDLNERGNPLRAVDAAERRYNDSFSWQSNTILNWDKDFGIHRLSFTGLYNTERNQSWETRAINNTFSPTAGLGYHAMQLGLNPTMSSYDEVNSRTGVMGRVNYAYDDRFNFSASIRRDGFSRFGINSLYGNFPSLSAAWTLTNEDFMPKGKVLSYLKTRVSYGVNGNSSGLEDYNAFARLSNGVYLNYDGGYVATPYTEINRIANPLLSWENTASFNIGIDYGFFNDRLSGSLDLYKSETRDLLLDQKLPDLTGFGSVKTNVGNLQNSGFDLGINSINVSNSNFAWRSTFNVTYRINKITTLGNKAIPITDAEGNTVVREPDDLQNGWFIGKNKDVIWDWDLNGIYQLGEEDEAAQYGLFPGDFRFVDQNGDGRIDLDDRVFLGLRENPWYMTLRNDFEWKGFDFGLVFLAKLGYLGGTREPFNNNQEYIKNHNWYKIPYWTPLNGENNFARINSINLGGGQTWINRSYLRLQNVSVGYSLPQNLTEKIKSNRVRLAVNIENAAVFTGWIRELGDPESAREMPRTYSFSLDVTF